MKNNNTLSTFIIGIIFLFIIILSIGLKLDMGFYMFLFIASCFFVSYMMFNKNKVDKRISDGILFSIIFGILYMIFDFGALILFIILSIGNIKLGIGLKILLFFILIFSLGEFGDLLFLSRLGIAIFIGNYFLNKGYALKTI